MSTAVNKVKRILLLFAIALVIALSAVCIVLADNRITAKAEDEPYTFILTERSYVYNGKPIDIPVSVSYQGEEITDYTVSYILNGETVSVPKVAGDYTAKITINNLSPSVSGEVTFTITPKPLNLVIGGSNTFLYSGMDYSRNVSPLGICDGDDCEIITTYRGNTHVLEAGELPVAADNYDMVFSTSNPNYSIGAVEGEATLVIQKRTLYVSVNDTSVRYGETPEFTMNIIGFVAGEDESVITQKPTIRFNDTEVGVHQVTAGGAQAENYDFKYNSGYVTINGLGAKGKIQDSSIDFSVTGVFTPSTVYEGVIVDADGEEGKEFIKTAKDYRMLNFTSKIQEIYKIETENGAQLSDKITVTFNNVTSLNSKDNYVIVIIDQHGVVTKITKYEYANGTLTFTAPSLGTVLIFKDTFEVSVIVISIAAIIAFILILFFAEKVQYRNDKRYADEQARQRRKKRNEYRW